VNAEGDEVPTTRRRLLVGTGLASLLAKQAGAAPTPPERPDLPIGMLFPFSGALALFGDESFRGLELATRERNTAGGLLGRQVRLVRAEGAEPAQAAAEVKRLIETEKVAAVFGSFSSALAIAASQVSDRAGVPYFELDAIADMLTRRGLKYLFRSCPTASAYAAATIDSVTDVLAQLWGVAPATLRLATLSTDEVQGSEVAAAQAKLCGLRGLTLVDKITYLATALDFGSVIQRLRGAGIDVVLHSGQGSDVLTFQRALRQAGWRPRMVLGAGAAHTLVETAGALGEGLEGTLAVDVTPYRIAPACVPDAADIAASYQQNFGAPPRSGHSLACFLGARFFYDAIARAGSLDHDAIRTAVLSTDIDAGWGVRFDETGQNLRARSVLSQWQRGVLVAVAPAEAAVAPVVPVLGG
jgi:branched-chain amino acid transport system substrate-binding protein